MSDNYFNKYAPALLDMGYEPIPIRTTGDGRHKAPLHKGWQDMPVNKDTVSEWATNGQKKCNVGIRTGLVLGIDVDVYHKGISKKLAKWIDQRWGGSSGVLRRFGMAPKWLTPVLCDDVTTKENTPKFKDKKGNINQIEILAKGQQFVAVGVHPATGKEYQWVNGSLTDEFIHFLPRITRKDIDALFTEFKRLAEREGLESLEVLAADGVEQYQKERITRHDGVLSPGDAYNDTIDPRQLLSFYGWKPSGKSGSMQDGAHVEYWTRPGKRRGISASLIDGKYLYVFSSSAPELPDHHAYDAFGIYTRYEHGGDFNAAAKSLTNLVPEKPNDKASEVFDAVEEPHTERRTDLSFGFYTANDIIQDIKPTEWLIEGVLEDKVLGCLFGQPGAYKSFVALSWACCIATGTQWFGHKVTQGPVFYIVGEGQSGMAKRIKAWMIGNDIDSIDNLYISKTPMQVLNQASALSVRDTLLYMRDLHGKPAAVVIDTVARNYGGGDENSTSDMSKFIMNIDSYIGNDCLRLLVHHTGHSNQDRARGNSALLGALDAEYLLVKKDSGNAHLKNTKMKDEPEWAKEMILEPRQVIVAGEFENPVSSLYLTTSGWSDKRHAKMSKQMTQCVSILTAVSKKEADPVTGKREIGSMEHEEYKRRLIEAGIYSNKTIYRGIERMEKRELIQITDGIVYEVK